MKYGACDNKYTHRETHQRNDEYRKQHAPRPEICAVLVCHPQQMEEYKECERRWHDEHHNGLGTECALLVLIVYLLIGIGLLENCFSWYSSVYCTDLIWSTNTTGLKTWEKNNISRFCISDSKSLWGMISVSSTQGAEKPRNKDENDETHEFDERMVRQGVPS